MLTIMNRTQPFRKLTELRSKTDRQLIAFITHRLDSGLNYARLAAGPDSVGDWTSAEVFQSRAERAYDEARVLMPWLEQASHTELQRLESKLLSLRGLLEESTIHAEIRVETACS